jgi:peptidoglycan-associated lipoprotein
MQSKHYFKVGVLVISLFSLAACSSTSDTEEAADASQTAGSGNNNNANARSNPAPSTPRLSQGEIRAANAMRQTVFYFEFDIAEFKSADRDTLTFHARDMAANPNKRIRLQGHADERGTREYNLALGERRANSILNYFIVNGASRSQIEVVSYGEERPSQRGQSEQAYSRNRRVEVVSR